MAEVVFSGSVVFADIVPRFRDRWGGGRTSPSSCCVYRLNRPKIGQLILHAN